MFVVSVAAEIEAQARRRRCCRRAQAGKATGPGKKTTTTKVPKAPPALGGPRARPAHGLMLAKPIYPVGIRASMLAEPIF